MQTTFRFTGVRDQPAAERLLARNCNDGSVWVVWTVFDILNANRVDRAPRCDPDLPGNFVAEHYWQSGKWHARKPATAKQVARSWQKADRAAGVSDGGNPRADFKRWARRINQINRRANAAIRK